MSEVQAADWLRRVREVDQLVAGSHYKQALQEAGSVLESLLKDSHQRTINHVSPTEQKLISDKLEKLGKGKPVADLTLGQIVEFFRKADFFHQAYRPTAKTLPHL